MSSPKKKSSTLSHPFPLHRNLIDPGSIFLFSSLSLSHSQLLSRSKRKVKKNNQVLFVPSPLRFRTLLFFFVCTLGKSAFCVFSHPRHTSRKTLFNLAQVEKKKGNVCVDRKEVIKDKETKRTRRALFIPGKSVSPSFALLLPLLLLRPIFFFFF